MITSRPSACQARGDQVHLGSAPRSADLNLRELPMSRDFPPYSSPAAHKVWRDSLHGLRGGQVAKHSPTLRSNIHGETDPTAGQPLAVAHWRGLGSSAFRCRQPQQLLW
jgi:hypothetical protein